MPSQIHDLLNQCNNIFPAMMEDELESAAKYGTSCKQDVYDKIGNVSVTDVIIPLTVQVEYNSWDLNVSAEFAKVPNEDSEPFNFFQVCIPIVPWKGDGIWTKNGEYWKGDFSE